MQMKSALLVCVSALLTSACSPTANVGTETEQAICEAWRAPLIRPSRLDTKESAEALDALVNNYEAACDDKF